MQKVWYDVTQSYASAGEVQMGDSLGLGEARQRNQIEDFQAKQETLSQNQGRCLIE